MPITIPAPAAAATKPAPRPVEGFGAHLRRWRQARGLSQLDLALSCDTSQRHISFLESGRSRPSRGMVLNLAGALAVPLRHQDSLLLAAGFAPAFGMRPAEAPEMQPVQAVLDRMLDRQEPYPAVVVDRHYTLVRANGGAGRLLAFLLGDGAVAAGPAPNLMRLLFAPPVDGLVENLAEIAQWTVRRLRAEAVMEDPLAADPPLLRLLLDHPVMAQAARRTPAAGEDGATPPALTVRFRKDGLRLAFLTVIASLGTPLDAGLQDLRVELFFPADEATRAWLEQG